VRGAKKVFDSFSPAPESVNPREPRPKILFDFFAPAPQQQLPSGPLQLEYLILNHVKTSEYLDSTTFLSFTEARLRCAAPCTDNNFQDAYGVFVPDVGTCDGHHRYRLT